MPHANTSRYAILGLLSLEPMSGYDMKKFVDMAFRHFWSESYGGLYPALKALEAQGLVTSKTQRTAGKPDRIVYRITGAGRRILKEWLTRPAELPRVRSELLLKLFFGKNVPMETTIEQITRQRAACMENLARFRQYERMIDEREKDAEQRVFYRLTIMNGKMVNEARIRWCDEAVKALRADRESGEESS